MSLKISKPVAAIIISLFFGGCCYFFPCHRGTGIIGTVQDAGGKPINSAIVSPFGNSKNVGDNGCFVFHAADATPFTITADAPGYKPYSGDVKYGRFRVVIILQPDVSNLHSEISWTKISESEFEAEKKYCP